MPSWFIAARIVHIVAGFTALFVGPIAMVTLKGGKAHRISGLVYVYGMAVVSVTAIAMAFYRINLFLFLVAIFSFYMAFTGVRVLRCGKQPAWFDWGASVLVTLASLGLVIVGGRSLLLGEGSGTIALVFGLLGAMLGSGDLRRFANPPQDRRAWWFQHMQAMLGAYIATVSAFSAVNFEFLPVVVRWLWPTVVGTVGISVWTAHYRRKFSGVTRRPIHGKIRKGKPTP